MDKWKAKPHKNGLAEIWKRKDVLSNLVIFGLRHRYKGSILGFLWTLLNPLVTMTIMAFVFSMVFRFQVKNYALYIFSGMIPWGFFANVMANSSHSLIAAEPYLKKIALPKLIFPLHVLISETLNFVFNLIALFILGAILRIWPPLTSFWIPVVFIIFAAFCFGLAVMGSLASVFFRDLNHLIPLIISLLFYLTPIIYPTDAIPETRRWIFELNPFYWFVSIFHDIIYHGLIPSLEKMLIAIGLAVVSCSVSLMVFRKLEDRIIFRL